MSIPTEERYPPLKLSPQQKKERTLATLLDNLETLFTMGEFVEARQYLQRTIAFCDSDRATVTDLRFSIDHKVAALGFLA
jgi:hypothetical protein